MKKRAKTGKEVMLTEGATGAGFTTDVVRPS
jgi:hydrogenase maturation factor HypE